MSHYFSDVREMCRTIFLMSEKYVALFMMSEIYISVALFPLFYFIFYLFLFISLFFYLFFFFFCIFTKHFTAVLPRMPSCKHTILMHDREVIKCLYNMIENFVLLVF